MTDETAEAAKPTSRIFKVRNFIDADQLKKDMTFSLADLSTAMVEQSGLLVNYGILAAKASRQVDDLKMLIEATESKVYRILRDRAAAEGGKVTEAQLEKAVASNSQVIALKKALNEGKQIESIAKIAVEGFKHRRDMLIQQGSYSREEMKGELSISRRNAQEEVLAQQKERVLERMGQS